MLIVSRASQIFQLKVIISFASLQKNFRMFHSDLPGESPSVDLAPGSSMFGKNLSSFSLTLML